MWIFFHGWYISDSLRKTVFRAVAAGTVRGVVTWPLFPAIANGKPHLFLKHEYIEWVRVGGNSSAMRPESLIPNVLDVQIPHFYPKMHQKRSQTVRKPKILFGEACPQTSLANARYARVMQVPRPHWPTRLLESWWLRPFFFFFFFL